jgi:hypothetical protein
MFFMERIIHAKNSCQQLWGKLDWVRSPFVRKPHCIFSHLSSRSGHTVKFFPFNVDLIFEQRHPAPKMKSSPAFSILLFLAARVRAQEYDFVPADFSLHQTTQFLWTDAPLTWLTGTNVVGLTNASENVILPRPSSPSPFLHQILTVDDCSGGHSMLKQHLHKWLKRMHGLDQQRHRALRRPLCHGSDTRA